MARILVLEDEALIGLALRMTLEDAGHEVFGPSPTVAHALRVAEGLDGAVDLALIDYNLAEGDLGSQACAQLHARWGIQGVYTTAHCDLAFLDPECALGCLRKPYDTGLLAAVVACASAVAEGGEPRWPRGFIRFRFDRPGG